MGNLGRNLLFLRTRENLMQSEICDRLGFKRNTWSNWENGKAIPDIETVLSICAFFHVDISDILLKDLEHAHLSEKNIQPLKQENAHLKAHAKAHPTPKSYTVRTGKTPVVEEGFSPYNDAKMPILVTVGEDGIENIIYVPVKARAGYLLGYGDPTFIQELPAFRMPGINHGTYRMFEVEGASMAPTLASGDRVIGEWVDNWANIRENRVYIVVHKGGVAVKRVVPRLADGKIFLKSDTLVHRAEFPIVEVDLADVLEVWYVRMRVTANLSEPTELYTKVNDLEILVHKLAKRLDGTK